MVDLVGQQLGNYRLVRLLGQGGFADVYLGEHVHLHTQAAIKVLQMRLVESNAEAFLNEARTIAHLAHPHIIRVLDFRVEDTTPFLVMDYAPGGTLRQRYLRGTPLPPETLFPYIPQIASALQYAHDRKLIHRDVKPENMLLGANGGVLLSDFGLALVSQSSTGSRSSKDMSGTATYMAPEQLQGKPRPASDQYSLGIVVYEWLTGTRPFQGSFIEVASQQMLVQPPPLREKVPTIPSELENVVLKALSKDPAQRYPNISDFANALEQASRANGINISALPTLPVLVEDEARASMNSTVSVSLTASPQPAFVKAAHTPVDPEEFQPTLAKTPLPYDASRSPSVLAASNQPAQPGAAASLPQYGYSQSYPLSPQPSGQAATRNRAWLFVGVVLVLLLVVGSTTGILYFLNSNKNSSGTAYTTITSGNQEQHGQGQAVAAGITPTATIDAAAQSQTNTTQVTPSAQAQSAQPSATTQAITNNSNTGSNLPDNSKLVIDDSLSSNHQNWDVTSSYGNSCQFSGGVYQVTVARNYGGPCFARSTNFSNFAYQIHMTFIKVNPNFSGGGIVFRSDNSGSHYYYFEIFESGSYSLVSCAGNDCSHLIAGYPKQPQPIPSFNTTLGQSNMILLIANGGEFTIYVNGQRAVGPVSDTTYSQGQLGVYAEGGTGNASGTEITFSDMKVWQI